MLLDYVVINDGSKFMIRLFRRFTDTWVVRGLLFVLAAAFALWGVAGRNPFGADPTTIAVVGGRPIPVAQVQENYAREMTRVRSRLGADTEPNDALRHDVAEQALDQVVTEAALDDQSRRLGVTAPEGAVRAAVFARPDFQGPDGKFDHAAMVGFLDGRRMSEARFADLMQQSMVRNQLFGAVQAGAAAPGILLARIYAAEHETRIADAVDVRFAAMPPPPPATDAQLHRWVDNHPERYSTPEYRHLKAVVLTPDEIAKTVTITDPEIATAYEQRSASLNNPERRTLDVVTVADETRARDLAAQWRTGADWNQMQAAATAAGALSTELPDISRADVPFPELATAAFSLPEHTVSDPIKSAAGFSVAAVAKITPAAPRTLADVHDELRDALAREKANDLLSDRQREVEDLLAGGTPFEKLWSELGLVPTAGTLDGVGKTPAGTDAPIPVPAGMRDAVIKAAFSVRKDDPPKLIPVPYPGAAGTTPQGYFAVAVDQITPPAPRPFDQVADAARADYARNETHRAADTIAAGVLAAVQSGQPIATAAQAQKLEVRRLPPIPRDRPPVGVPASLVKPLFSLKPQQATMVETPEGFVVAQLAQVVSPEPAGDPVAAARTRQALERSIAQDTDLAFTMAAREAAQARIYPAQVDAIARNSGGS